jgi:hypothetical protein
MLHSESRELLETELVKVGKAIRQIFEQRDPLTTEQKQIVLARLRKWALLKRKINRYDQ